MTGENSERLLPWMRKSETGSFEYVDPICLTSLRRDTICGIDMPNESLPEWEHLLSAAAHLQQLLPGATLVGGTAVAIYAGHRISHDADHVLPDLRFRFDQVLAELESVAGWTTARVTRPVMILGSLDGIETGIRQLIRETPLDTQQVTIGDASITVPTEDELLRIKSVLILRRNATRDYLDFAALQERMGSERALRALETLDNLYPQANGESAMQQLQVQLSNPIPFDLESADLSEYRLLSQRWKNWDRVKQLCGEIAVKLLQRL